MAPSVTISEASSGALALRRRVRSNVSRATATTPAISAPTGSAAQIGSPSPCVDHRAAKAPRAK